MKMNRDKTIRSYEACIPLTSGVSWRLSSMLVFGLIALGLSVSTTAQDDSKLETFKFSGKTMGPIPYHVVIATSSSKMNSSLVESEIELTLERINQLMSTYKKDSDVSRFNASQSTDWQPVDAETAAVVRRALEISEITNGDFDVTVGPAVNLWQFGPGRKKKFELPSNEEVQAVKSRVGFRFLECRLEPPALKKANPGLYVDLSAIAKGYAVDQVASTLTKLGFENYMVEVGGEVFAHGQRAGGGGWRIGIESPESLVQKVGRIAELSGRAMATSGDYRNFEEVNGKRYSHTIDPETCRPVEHSLASACVVASDCMTADAFATAVTVMGAEEGADVCRRNGLELLTIERDSDFGSELTESASTGFPFLTPNDISAVVPAGAGGDSIWPTFVGAAVVFLLATLGMAMGALFANKPLRGSCGGLSSMTNSDGETSCTICAKPTTDCVERGGS